MLKSKKYLSLLLVIAFVAAVFASCAPSAPPSSSAPASSAPAASTPASSTAPAAPGPATLTVTWWGGQARHDYTQQLLDMYSAANSNITFEPSPGDWGGYWDSLSVQAAGGTMPDIIQMDYMYISTYSNNTMLADLWPLVNGGTIDASNIDGAMLNAGDINGRLAGIPLSLTILALGTNPEVLAEAGISSISPNWTWDDFVSTNIQVKEKTGKFGFASNIEEAIWLQYWVRQNGFEMFNEANTGLGFSDPALVASFIEWQLKLLEAGAMPNPDEYSQIITLDHGARPVATGNAAFVTNWSNYASVVAANYEGATVTIPPQGANKALWQKPGMFFSIAESSKNKEEAAKFVDWFINSTEANDVIRGERGTPVSSAIRSYLLGLDLTRAQKLMFEYVDLATPYCGETPPPDPEGLGEVNSIIKTNVDKALYGLATPQQAAESIISEANAVLARNA